MNEVMTSRTVSEYVPELKSYKPGTPVDINSTSLNLRHIETASYAYGRNGHRKAHIYANDYYSFHWYEPKPNETHMCIFNTTSKNLFDADTIYAWKPDLSKPYRLTVTPPKTRLEDAKILETFETERLILCKTLLDLDAIIREKHGMWVLNNDLAAAFKTRLNTAM